MKRIHFIKSFLVGLISFPFLSFKSCKGFGEDGCYADSDVVNPIFCSGAPNCIDLADGYSGDGTALIVYGKVFGKNCSVPIENAQIDIWHASPEGQYDLNSDKFLFRGKLQTDENGFYQFRTLPPKGYRDGGTGQTQAYSLWSVHM